MDANTVTQIVGSLGFPIAACIGLFWYLVKVQTQNTEALNNNTLAITKLVEKLDGGKNERADVHELFPS